MKEQSSRYMNIDFFSGDGRQFACNHLATIILIPDSFRRQEHIMLDKVRSIKKRLLPYLSPYPTGLNYY
jgi:hypothetical protein